MESKTRILITVTVEELKALQKVATLEKWSWSNTAKQALLFYLKARRIIKG
jgi:hypothetical protein